jgi:hypothetical protein
VSLDAALVTSLTLVDFGETTNVGTKRRKNLVSSNVAFTILFNLCRLLIIDLVLYKILSVILSLLSSNTMVAGICVVCGSLYLGI